MRLVVVPVNPLVQIAPLGYMSSMIDEPKDIRLPVMVTRSEAQAIDDWRFERRISSRAEAMRQLISAGLAASKALEAPAK